MFTATLQDVGILKKVTDAIKDIIQTVNIEAGANGMNFQAMDMSHVALVSLQLRPEGFSNYSAHKNYVLGIKLANMSKILRCAQNADQVTMECEEEPQALTFRFQSPGQERSATFSMNLVVQEEEAVQIPDTTYASRVTM